MDASPQLTKVHISFLGQYSRIPYYGPKRYVKLSDTNIGAIPTLPQFGARSKIESDGPSFAIIQMQKDVAVSITDVETGRTESTSVPVETRWGLQTLRQSQPCGGVDEQAGVQGLKNLGIIQKFRNSAKALPARLEALLAEIGEGDEEDRYLVWFKKYGSKVALILADRMPTLDLIYHLKIPRPLFVQLTAAVREVKARYNKFMRNEAAIPNADTSKASKPGKGGIGGAIASAARSFGRWVGKPNLPLNHPLWHLTGSRRLEPA